METIDTDPPSSRGSRPLFTQAVWASLLLPVLTLIGWGASRALPAGLPETARDTLVHMGGALAFGVALAGLAFGVLVAMSGKSDDKRGLVPFAVTGAILNLGLLAALSTGGAAWFQKQARAQSSLNDLRQEAQAVAREAQERLTHVEEPSNGSNRMGFAGAAVDRIQKKIEVAAREVSGPESAVLSAASDYLTRLKHLSQDYEHSAAAVQAMNVNDASSLSSKEGLAPRRQAVNEFIEANSRLKEFLDHAEERAQECLKRHAVAASAQESFMTTFRKSRERHRLLLQVRETDERIGNATLGLL
ncbi:MAG: hypothetical protein HYR88_14940, partial [Verrucomicrobia bacterium]|nr:hypothetical protein [Verrucomicrobiota bacterium]